MSCSVRRISAWFPLLLGFVLRVSGLKSIEWRESDVPARGLTPLELLSRLSLRSAWGWCLVWSVKMLEEAWGEDRSTGDVAGFSG